MDEQLLPTLFVEDGIVTVNSDCGNPFEQGYQVTHLMPDNGPAHLFSIGCWCHPELDHEDPNNGSEIWTHHGVN